ncbi:MAG: NADH:ubiquinone oxidoreductase [Deltaproteobacteria bacterium]|nr:NADH:ubiquinone oxidoreductase [Deltaproteobacteria bacterium]MBW2258235.1 NADH:ubiquinone oxidoreductase [Deltaproteobacteria bacterium]
MKYLGIQPARPKVAVFDFTGCEGCELQLANKEASLGAFLASVEVVNFREISSEARDDYAIAFIDGCISRDDEVKRLQAIRGRAEVLVAMGSCACFGGVHRMKNAFDLAEANAEVYGDAPKETSPVRAVKEVVPVDLEIPGCPVSKAEIERIVQHVVLGVPFAFPVYPVCVDCKHQFTTCMFEHGELCLGPITRAGCGAPCPAGGLGCWGCRGPSEDCNIEEFRALAAERGFEARELTERLAFFGGFEELR